jgi:hypothetical protein
LLVVGMYDPDRLERLPIIDANGQMVTGNAIPLTRLTLP